MPKRPLLSRFSGPKKMIKNITISVVFLTILILTSNTAKAADYLDLAVNSHVSDNVSYLKSLAHKNDPSENTPEPTPAPVQKTKVIKVDTKTRPIATLVVTVSAYSSTPDQTKYYGSPFTTANNERVYWGGVAANIIDADGRNVPFGTKIKIPELFNNQVFTVNDRMNRRYQNNIDIWFPNRSDALEFGRKTVKIIVVADN